MRQIDTYFSFEPTTPLHHYTGIGMLLELGKETEPERAKELWASNVNYLNDSQEISHAKDVMRYVTAPARLAFAVGGDHLWFVEAFREWLPMALSKPFDMFIFSLSEHRSLLSQWRSYTPHGKGVSISFSTALIREIATINVLKIGQCIYELEAQRTLIESLIESLWITWQNRHSGRPASPEVVSRYFDEHRYQILQVLALIKHEAFKEEAEWRLISRSEPAVHDVCYRQAEGASLLTPYIKLKLPVRNYLFESVTLGPTPHQDLSLMALKGFIDKTRLSANVYLSEIPFRKW
jgi:hypothetical protein